MKTVTITYDWWEAEGWYDVKGNHGVKLISCNEWEFDDMGVTVS